MISSNINISLAKPFSTAFLIFLSANSYGNVVALECSPSKISLLDTKTYRFSDDESCAYLKRDKPASLLCTAFRLEFSANDSNAFVDKPSFLENSLQFTKQGAYEYQFQKVGSDSEALRTDVTLKINRVSLEYSWLNITQVIVQNESVHIESWSERGSCMITKSRRDQRKI